MLWVRISNPKDPAKSSHAISAKVDTGTDICIFPLEVADEIDIDLTRAKEIDVKGVVTEGKGYLSKATIEVLEPDYSPISGTTQTINICFIKDCHHFLLGANFLRQFVLTIDYPNQVFSATLP